MSWNFKDSAELLVGYKIYVCMFTFFKVIHNTSFLNLVSIIYFFSDVFNTSQNIPSNDRALDE